jgi:hypothetical protein
MISEYSSFIQSYFVCLDTVHVMLYSSRLLLLLFNGSSVCVKSSFATGST